MTPLGARGTSGGSEGGSSINSIWRRAEGRRATESRFTGLFEARSFSQALPPWAQGEWESLRAERHPEIQGEGLLALARRLSRAGREDAAVEIFSFLATNPLPTGGGARRAPLQESAQLELDAILGRGSISRRAEYLGSRLAREASEPLTLAGMIAGSAVFNISRTAFLSRLLGSGSSSLFTRGLGARALAGSGAFLLEVPAFWGSTKLLRELAHPGAQSWDFATNLRELAGAGITLGALKLTGWGASAASRRILGTAPLTPRSFLIQGLAHQSGMLAGILMGHRLEEMASLRSHQDGATTFIDSLAMLIQFNVAGRLTRGLGGESLGRLAQELEARSASPESRGPGFFPLPGFAMEGARSGARLGTREGIESLQRPLLMAMDPNRSGSSKPSSGALEFLQRATRESRPEDLRRLKDLVFEIYSTKMVRQPSENLSRYHRSTDPEEWKQMIRIIGSLTENHESALEIFASDEGFRKYREEWESRPHFASLEDVPVERTARVPHNSQYANAIFELRKELYRYPSLKGWSEFVSRQKGIASREPKKIFAMSSVETSAGRFYLGNWRTWGLQVSFDSQGHFVAPIRIRARFSDAELREEIERLKNPPVAEAPTPPIASREVLSFLPQPNENPSHFALRLISEGGKGREHYLGAARGLTEMMRDPARRDFALASVERLTSLSQNLDPKSTIVARKYSLTGIEHPFTIVSVPSLFLPDSWSEVFAEGIVMDHWATRSSVGRAVEIGSGTGWVSLVMSRLNMAREILGLDLNPDAAVLGELNALLNGVDNVTFRESSLLSALSAEEKADLIIACIPQVPLEGNVSDLRARADYYPQRNSYMDRFGLGLVDEALGQSRERLTDTGRILFNLGGRPGRATLEEMFVRWGFHPTLRNGRMVNQDPKTDIQPLAQMEASTGHRYEFYLDDPSVSLSAQDAVGKTGLRHWLYLLEGRLYSNVLRGELSGALEPRRWGYTDDPGSENKSLREAVARDMSRQWGTAIDPEALFVTPSAESFIENWLRVVLPPQGKILAAGNAAERVTPVLLRMERHSASGVPSDLETVIKRLESEPTAALILEQPGTHAETADQIRRLFAAAARNGTRVLLVEPYPRRQGRQPNLWTDYLSTNLSALENTVLLQPYNERWDVSDLPLAAAVVANPILFGRLTHEAEASYSRVSTPLQELYLRSLRTLESGVHGEDPPSGSIHPLVVEVSSGEGRIRILDAHPAFHSSPRADHPDPIHMSFGESEASLKVDFRAAAREALRTPYPRLYAQAQEAVRDYLIQSRGLEYRPEQIMLEAGVQPLIGSVLRAMRAMDPGRTLEVLVPKPSYGLFFPTVELAGAKLREVQTVAASRFLVDAAALSSFGGNGKSAPSPQRALLMNQPTNPAGVYYRDAEWRSVLDWVKREDGYLLLDDVFGLLRFPTTRNGVREHYWAAARERLRHRLIAFGGLSKEFAAGGIRFGFALSDQPDLLTAIRPSTRPDPLALAAALEILPQWRSLVEAHNRYLAHRMLQLTGLFAEKNIPYVEAEGGYSLFVDFRKIFGREFRSPGRPRPIVDASNLHEIMMEEAGIKIYSEAWARVPGWYRFVYSIERIDEAVARLRKFFRNLR